MKEIKDIFLNNLKDINKLISNQIEHSDKLTRLYSIFIMGATTVNDSSLSASKKLDLYKFINDFSQHTSSNIYNTFENIFIDICNDILSRWMKKNKNCRNYNCPFNISIDDTSLEVFGKEMEKSKKLHNGKKFYNGYHVVFITMNLGNTIKLPLSFRFYDYQSNNTRIDDAIIMLNSLMKKLIIKPNFITFDNLYLKEKLTKVLRSIDLDFTSKYKKNHKPHLDDSSYTKITNQTLLFKNGYYHQSPYSVKEIIKIMKKKNIRLLKIRDKKLGELKLVIDENKAIVSSSKNIYSPTIVKQYSYRWKIEEMFRACKQNFALKKVYLKDFTKQIILVGAKFIAGAFVELLKFQKRRLRKFTHKELVKLFNQCMKIDMKNNMSSISLLAMYKL